MSLVGHVITGYQGAPHVSASDAGLFNAGIVGLKRYVLGTGEVFRTAVFPNRILIYPGDLVDQGRHINLPAMAEIHIPSAPVGYQRRYIIAMKYNRNETGVESAGLYLIGGVAAQSDPALPTGTRGDIFAGADEDDTYLYDVLVDETGIVSCEPNAEDFIVIDPLSDIQEHMVSTYANGTAQDAYANADKNCRLVKAGKHVTCYMGIGYSNGTTTLGSGTTSYYFSVPSGYRPPSNVVFPAIARMSSGIVRICNLTCNSNGLIYTASPNMGTATAIYGTLEWDVE